MNECQRQRVLRQGGHVRRGKMLGEWRFHDGLSVLFSFLFLLSALPFLFPFPPPSFSFPFPFCKCTGIYAVVMRNRCEGLVLWCLSPVLVSTFLFSPSFFFFRAQKPDINAGIFACTVRVSTGDFGIGPEDAACLMPRAERGSMSCMFSFACMYVHVLHVHGVKGREEEEGQREKEDKTLVRRGGRFSAWGAV
ncbi:hypothetical protein V8C34DRAFT_273770, partial [Trichoderma compactum]